MNDERFQKQLKNVFKERRYLEYVDEDLLDNLDFANAVIDGYNNCDVVQYYEFSERVRADKSLALKAIINSEKAFAFNYLPMPLRQDPEIFSLALDKNVNHYCYLPDEEKTFEHLKIVLKKGTPDDKVNVLKNTHFRVDVLLELVLYDMYDANRTKIFNEDPIDERLFMVEQIHKLLDNKTSAEIFESKSIQNVKTKVVVAEEHLGLSFEILASHLDNKDLKKLLNEGAIADYPLLVKYKKYVNDLIIKNDINAIDKKQIVKQKKKRMLGF
jgi:hypothetical protein